MSWGSPRSLDAWDTDRPARSASHLADRSASRPVGLPGSGEFPTPIARNVNSELREWASKPTLVGGLRKARPTHPEWPTHMTNNSIRWGLAAVATILAQIALIALSILCVAVYSYTIHT